MAAQGRGNWQGQSRSSSSGSKSQPNLGDYVEVPERIKEFHEKYPEGTLSTVIQESGLPYKIQQIQGESSDIRTGEMVVQSSVETYLVVVARARKNPGDEWTYASAWEPFPGRTPYTRNSELMNAETSAYGRVLGALGIGVKRSLASAEEVRNRSAERAERDVPQAARSPEAIAEDVRQRGVTQGRLKTLYYEAQNAGHLKAEVPDWDGQPVTLYDLIVAAKSQADAPNGREPKPVGITDLNLPGDASD